MSDIATITLTGRVGTEPERKTLPSGTDLATFRFASSQYEGPNKEESTGWYTINLWGGRSKVAEYIKKGSKLTVTGNLKVQEWTTDSGELRRDLVVDAGDVVLPPKAAASDGPSPKQRAKPTDDLPF